MTNNQKETSEQDALGRLSNARDQLDLVLGFFARVETKLSVVLGINLGMLGLLAAKAPPLNKINLACGLVTAVFLAFSALSLYQLYRASSPSLNGGERSNIYFREIAGRREAEFVEAYGKLSPDELAKDYLCQAWGNARILTQKFDNLKLAYRFMACSILPWVVSLGFFVRIGQSVSTP